MADENEDPREVAWHPRHTQQLVGHAEAANTFTKAFNNGRPHHAWLMTGPKGIGKATLAYHLAGHVLGQNDPVRTARWIAARSHPDIFVLERKLGETKPRKLKAEISIDDARELLEFFSHTSSGGWRIGLVDAADDLNTESANALLKLVEEPPPKCLIFLVCNLPGRLLRTIKSRCTRLTLDPLQADETLLVLKGLALEPKVMFEDLQVVSSLAEGSPGRALSLLKSEAAKAFEEFLALAVHGPGKALAISNRFGGKGAVPDDFNIFGDLLLNWTATRAAETSSLSLSKAYSKISEKIRVANAFNTDRKQAIMDAVKLVQEALKVA